MVERESGASRLFNVLNYVFLAFIGIICLYLMYIPMMIGLMVKAKELGPVKRFVLPILGVACCLFFCYAIWTGYGWKQCVGFLIFFAVVMFIGYLFERYRVKNAQTAKK